MAETEKVSALSSATQTGYKSVSDIQKLCQSIFDATVLSRTDLSLKPPAWFDLGEVCFLRSFLWPGHQCACFRFSLRRSSCAMFEGRETGELGKTLQMFEEMGFTE